MQAPLRKSMGHKEKGKCSFCPEDGNCGLQAIGEEYACKYNKPELDRILFHDDYWYRPRNGSARGGSSR